jgi:hypothetical protein
MTTTTSSAEQWRDEVIAEIDKGRRAIEWLEQEAERSRQRIARLEREREYAEAVLRDDSIIAVDERDADACNLEP